MTPRQSAAMACEQINAEQLAAERLLGGLRFPRFSQANRLSEAKEQGIHVSSLEVTHGTASKSLAAMVAKMEIIVTMEVIVTSRKKLRQLALNPVPMPKPAVISHNAGDM